jgi:hypothetical protein
MAVHSRGDRRRGTANLTVVRVRQNQLTVGVGATNAAKATIAATVTANQATSTGILNALSIAGTPTVPTSTLDLNSSSLILNYTGSVGTRLSDVTAQITAGRNGKDGNDQANWSGKGIITTKGRADNQIAQVDYYNLGAINNADLDLAGIGSHLNSLGGQTVTPKTVLLKYTYSGDANLSGTVDGDDYTYWLNGFLGLTDPSVHGWLRGDFDYNGVVDGDDYTQWLNTFLLNGPPLTGAGPAPVPEPGTWVLLGIAALSLVAYSWRRPKLLAESLSARNRTRQT